MFEKFTEEVSIDLPCGPFIDDDDGLEDDFVMMKGLIGAICLCAAKH